MKILAIDTSSDTGSVGLIVDGRPVAELTASARARHGATLLPYVEQVLALGGVGPADLDLVAIGLGPGSFTGLRVGLATAKGLAVAQGTPLVGVSSLRVLARGAGDGWVVPIVDAQRGEVFAAIHRVRFEGGTEERLAPFHAPPGEAATRLRDAMDAVGSDALPSAPVRWLGSGLRRYADVLNERCLSRGVVLPPAYDVPRATWLAAEAEEMLHLDGPSDLAELEPIYVRPTDAKLPAKPLAISD